ncbi:TPA: aldehyde ferredoxin oxidoreductase [bacterium]|nr:aldehyde ferredoxin oxidoreductase [bacterium]
MKEFFMLYSYAGVILVVNMTTGEIEKQPLNEQYARDYVGGRGLGARYLYDLLKPGIDPLSADNVIIMMTGPFTGTGIYSCQKYEWVSKSPLTNIYLCSNSGGKLGVNLKRSGYDGIIIKGKADGPKYIYIDGDNVEIRDASFVWGKMVSEVQNSIKEKSGADTVVCTGLSADLPNPVKFAGVYDGLRCSGRGGLGAVFASKNLKAIAVNSTEKKDAFQIYDLSGLKETLHGLIQDMKTNAVTGEQLPKFGSIIWMDTTAEFGILPSKNYQEILTYPEIEGKIDTKGFEKEVTKDEESSFVNCLNCPIKSGHVVTPDRGEWAGKPTKGPEFETAWSLGANVGIIDYGHIIAANKACNEYGIDTISVGGVIGFAMECYQKGLLDKNKVDGNLLRWGSSEAVLGMIKKIGIREDWLGDILADGVRSASKKIGHESEKFALHVKGMEVPAYDPRGVWGMGLTYATSIRGACHLKSWTVASEFQNFDPISTEGKAGLVKGIQDLRSVLDSLIVCFFAGRAITKDWIVKLINSVTDFGWKVEDIDTIGARIYNLERLLATREGVTMKDDLLPYRIMEEPLTGGQSEGTRITQENIEKMLQEYYDMRGWNKEGIPTSDIV